MIFSQEHVDTFRQLSWDRNDLHWNASYCRRAQFGEPIVYGVAVLLAALGRWADGRSFILKSVRADLKGPVLLGREIDFNITSDGDAATALIVDAHNVLARLSWTAAFRSQPAPWPRNIGSHFCDTQAYLTEANRKTPDEITLDNHEYSLNGEYIHRLSVFGLKPGQIPLSQLQFLLWTSYFVGMHYPGRQALYSSLNAIFTAESEEAGCAVTLSKITGKLKVGYGLAQIKVAASFLESASIGAFKRPEPVDYPVSEIKHYITNDRLLTGLEVFVSGSSRGLGSVLAKSAALMGAKLHLHARAESEESRKTLEEIRELSPESQIYYADLTRRDEARSLAHNVTQLASPQWIILNASPRIFAKHFTDQGSNDFHEFVLTSLRMSAELLHALLPQLAGGSKVILISSVYVREAPHGFSHYVAAKSALEGLVTSLAGERTDLQFLVLRLPRMRTDQTASPFSRMRMHSPIPVAVQMIERVTQIGGETNIHVLDYKPSPTQPS